MCLCNFFHSYLLTHIFASPPRGNNSSYPVRVPLGKTTQESPTSASLNIRPNAIFYDNWKTSHENQLLWGAACLLKTHVLWGSPSVAILKFAILENILKKFSFQQSAFGYSLSNVHIIGHSLGSHAAGEAGRRTNGTVGRITGWSKQ